MDLQVRYQAVQEAQQDDSATATLVPQRATPEVETTRRASINPNTIFSHAVAKALDELRQGLALTIGRDPGADVSVDDPMVSREHLRVVRVASGFEFTDLGSTNGTFYLDPWTGENGCLIPHEPKTLSSEMRITLGNHSEAIQFRVP